MLPRFPSLSTQAITTITADRSPDTMHATVLNVSEVSEDDDNTPMFHNFVKPHCDANYQDLSIFPNDDLDEPQYFKKYILPEKDLELRQFNYKLKHFFIFSISGKPIYSLHGDDDLIIGYSGLITTIISSFEDQLHEQVQTIDGDNCKILIMNKNPIILVSITKINFEKSLNQLTNQHYHLINQLEVLYNYLVSILSKPVISKYFQNRMNYDLRKILTNLDFKNLDDLSMQLTYGLSLQDRISQEHEPRANQANGQSHEPISEQTLGTMPHDNQQPVEINFVPGFEYFMGQLTDSLLTFKLSYTIRSKLSSLLLHNRIEEILFALLTVELHHIITLIKPKTHDINHQDLKMLLRIIKNNNDNIKSIETEDLWIPICLPNFNSSGFVYVYVKTFNLTKLLTVDGKYYNEPKLLNIILISTNKNNFFKVKEMANKLIENIIQFEAKDKLYNELINYEINLPNSMNHFVYKNKTNNQFVMSKMINNKNLIIKYVYYYSNLINSKSTTIKNLTGDNLNNNKKLSYIKYKNDEISFMISDDAYELYSIGHGELNDLIKDGLKVIKWCKLNDKRFFGNTVKFNF